MDKYNAETDAYRSISILEQFNLRGKTVIVTGAARGLGLAVAHGCAELGGRIAAIDVLEAGDDAWSFLQKLDAEARYYQYVEAALAIEYIHVSSIGRAHHSRTDITNKEALGKTFDKILQEFGRIDCVVNAAGVGGGPDFLSFDEASMDRILNVNVKGTMFVSQYAAQQMVKQGTGGSIVNFSSIGAHANIPGQKRSVYSASKGALLSFSRALAVEFAELGIRVNSVSPGFFLTAATPGYLTKDVSSLQRIEQSIPMRRIADRQELKGLVAFLVSPASSYITGQDFIIDGGVLAA